MKRIKLFCMVKDEGDILEDWLVYHAWLFGLDNLHIIDNESTEVQTLEILARYQDKGLKLQRRPDYQQKGQYLLEWVRSYGTQVDLFLPLDVDEFLVGVGREGDFASPPFTPLPVHEELVRPISRQERLAHILQDRLGTIASPQPYPISSAQLQICSSRDFIRGQLEQLPRYPRYAFRTNYTSLQHLPSYQDPLLELQSFLEVPSGGKKFFLPQWVTFLDHGHHYGRCRGITQSQEYRVERLALLHYHYRGDKRTVAKAINDLRGFDLPLDGKLLTQRLDQGRVVMGHHKVKTYLQYLEKGYQVHDLQTAGKLLIPELASCLPRLRLRQLILEQGLNPVFYLTVSFQKVASVTWSSFDSGENIFPTPPLKG